MKLCKVCFISDFLQRIKLELFLNDVKNKYTPNLVWKYNFTYTFLAGKRGKYEREYLLPTKQ